MRRSLSAGLLPALNTGTRGFMATICADVCLDALYRVDDLPHLAKQILMGRTITRLVEVLLRHAATKTAGCGRSLRVRQVPRIGGLCSSDLYHERIEDEEGNVIHTCDESVTGHQGHGSAKPKKP